MTSPSRSTEPGTPARGAIAPGAGVSGGRHLPRDAEYAGTGGGDVRALVYVDAFIPEVGETTFQILGGSGSAFDVPDPNAVFDIVGYPGAPEGDAEAFLKWPLGRTCPWANVPPGHRLEPVA